MSNMRTNIYTLNDFNDIKLNLIDIKLDDITMNLINDIANEVCSPNYKKTPIFKKKNKGPKASAFFKKTVLTKQSENDYGDAIMSDINKITESNYNNQLEIIKTNLLEFKDDRKLLLKIGKLIYDIGSKNEFLSELYSKLLYDLVTIYPSIKDSYSFILADYMMLYENIHYVEPNVDYNKFCEYNKKNSEIRAHSEFLVNLMINNLVNKNFIQEITYCLINKILDNLNTDNYKIEIEEFMENVLILYKKSYKIVDKDIYNKIQYISELKVKEYKSLTNKTIFKCLDVLETISL